MNVTFEPSAPYRPDACCSQCGEPATTLVGMHRPDGPVVAWEPVCASESCAAGQVARFERMFRAVWGGR